MNYCIIADDVEFGWPVIQIFVTVNSYIDVDNFSVKGCFTCNFELGKNKTFWQINSLFSTSKFEYHPIQIDITVCIIYYVIQWNLVLTKPPWNQLFCSEYTG